MTVSVGTLVGGTNYVASSSNGVVAVTAVFAGNLSTNGLPSDWSFTGGDYSNEVVRSVSNSVVGATTFIASVGTSSRTNVVVIISVAMQNPIDTDADGKVNNFATDANKQTGNAFGYSRTSTNCTIPVRVKIEPNTAEIRALLADKVTATLRTVATNGFTSTLSWDHAVGGDPINPAPPVMSTHSMESQYRMPVTKKPLACRFFAPIIPPT